MEKRFQLFLISAKMGSHKKKYAENLENMESF